MNGKNFLKNLVEQLQRQGKSWLLSNFTLYSWGCREDATGRKSSRKWIGWFMALLYRYMLPM